MLKVNVWQEEDLSQLLLPFRSYVKKSLLINMDINIDFHYTSPGEISMCRQSPVKFDSIRDLSDIFNRVILLTKIGLEG